MSGGTRGPGFWLGEDQLIWIAREIGAAAKDEAKAVVFIHIYPSDLCEGADRLPPLLKRQDVLCVDVGHTYGDELTNDGGTIDMASRLTGQIKEGPAGFSIAAIDGGCVSWRFVLIARPADRSLLSDMNQSLPSPFIARAKVIGDAPIGTVEARLDTGDWIAMKPVPDDSALWQASFNEQGEILTVHVRDALGRTDGDKIELATSSWTPPPRVADGSDLDRVGAWPEKGIFNTQFGPNRKRRKW